MNAEMKSKIYMLKSFIHPWTRKSDQHLIFPYSNTCELYNKIGRLEPRM